MYLLAQNVGGEGGVATPAVEGAVGTSAAATAMEEAVAAVAEDPRLEGLSPALIAKVL